MNRFFNIPSASPISQDEAYKIAIERFGVDRNSTREICDGIVFRDLRGTYAYVLWEELPNPTR